MRISEDLQPQTMYACKSITEFTLCVCVCKVWGGGGGGGGSYKLGGGGVFNQLSRYENVMKNAQNVGSPKLQGGELNVLQPTGID